VATAGASTGLAPGHPRRSASGDGEDVTPAEQADPTLSRAGEQWPSDPPLTPQQDHAVLSWLVVQAELPESVQGHLLAALTAWEPIMGPHLFPVEPLVGPDCDLADLLEAQWWRRSEQAAAARWHDRVALVEVCGRLGLAIADLRGRRVGQVPPEAD
jgi:hypothetical protein